MRTHHPLGTALPALEQNILKFRAFEMVLILFYVENLRAFALGAVRATDELRSSGNVRLPPGTKNLYRKLWSILVEEHVLTDDESAEIQRLIGYRDKIAHHVHHLTLDLSRASGAEVYADFVGAKYDYTAREKLKHYRQELSSRMRSKYVMMISYDGPMFKAAEKAFDCELKRLHEKIVRQLAKRKETVAALNTELSLKDVGLGAPFYADHPKNKTKGGRLTKAGVEVCNRLFDHGRSAMAVAYLMRLSYGAAVKRRRAWQRGLKMEVGSFRTPPRL